jgi:O-antigen/teichoic acid export membrane protein
MAHLEEKHGKLVARNSLLNLSAQVVSILIGLATIPYIVRHLGPNGFGILSIAWMLFNYFLIFDLGLSRATTKYVAECLNPGNHYRIAGVIWTSLRLQLLLGLVGGSAVASVVPFAVHHVFKMPAAWMGEARTSLFLLAASLPILLVSNCARGVLEGAQRFDLIVPVNMANTISLYVLAAVAVGFGAKVSFVILISVISRTLAAGAYLWLCCRVFPEIKRQRGFAMAELRPLASYGGWVTVCNASGPLFGYLERFVIASIVSVSALAYYSAPFELVSKTLIFPASIAPALFPYFSFHGNRRSVVSEASSRTIKYLLFVMTPITIVFVFFANPILHFWLGAEFARQSTMVMQLLAIVFFLNAFAQIPFTSVQALGRPDLKAILDMVALPAYALYTWWLTKHFGINGAASSKLICTVVDVGFLFWFARSLKAFSIRSWISGTLSRALAMSAALIAVVFGLQFFHPASMLAYSIVCLCFIVYSIAFWTMAIDAEDKVTILSIPRQLLARKVHP